MSSPGFHGFMAFIGQIDTNGPDILARPSQSQHSYQLDPKSMRPPFLIRHLDRRPSRFRFELDERISSATQNPQ